jgi:hypothetical protein
MPRKGAKNFSRAASHQRALFHRERQDKDIFDVTGQGRNALHHYEKWHSFPARFAGFACATEGIGPADLHAINTRFG